MDISIVIVNYKTKPLLLNCIKSIQAAHFAELQHEIIVVDNNSNDAIGEVLAWQHPDVIFIQNKYNGGMGAGNNVGIRRARGEYVVIMNPDTLALPDTFMSLYHFMEENPKVGIVGPKQLYRDMNVQDSCYRWHGLTTPIFRRTFLGQSMIGSPEINRFMMKDYDKSTIREVDWLLGSCLFMRAKAIKDAGLFDERFFLYFEDTDLCRRFWEKNWQVIYNPFASIIHDHNRESARQPWYIFFLSASTRHHVLSWWRYIMKWGLRRPTSH